MFPLIMLLFKWDVTLCKRDNKLNINKLKNKNIK